MSKQLEKNFFSKKKIFWYILTTILFIVFIFLIYKFIFKIEFNEIINSINNSYQKNDLFFLWIFLLLSFPLYNTFLTYITYWWKLRERGIFIKWYDWLIFVGINFFIRAITPFSMGSEPYSIYWLRRNGLQLKEATVIVASFTVVSPFVQILITWPSFFWMCSLYGNLSSNIAWKTAFWAVLVGITFDLIAACSMLIMSCSKRIHFIINIILNKIRKFIKLSYKTNDELKMEFIENQTFKKMFITEIKKWKFTLLLVVGNLFWNILYYLSGVFAFNLIDEKLNFNSFYIFNYFNVATTANNFIPIPGAEGTLQGLLSILIQSTIDSNTIDNKFVADITNQSIFVWRAFTFYLTAILGLICFLIYLYKEIRLSLLNKRNSSKKIFFIINIDVSKNIKKINSTIESIANSFYDLKCISINIVNCTNKKIISNIIRKYSESFAINSDTDKRLLESYNVYSITLESGSKITSNTLEKISNLKHKANKIIFDYKYYCDTKYSKTYRYEKTEEKKYCFIKLNKNISQNKSDTVKVIKNVGFCIWNLGYFSKKSKPIYI